MLPGLAFAMSTSSCTLFAGNEGCASSTMDCQPTIDTGVKSRSVS